MSLIEQRHVPGYLYLSCTSSYLCVLGKRVCTSYWGFLIFVITHWFLSPRLPFSSSASFFSTAVGTWHNPHYSLILYHSPPLHSFPQLSVSSSFPESRALAGSVMLFSDLSSFSLFFPLCLSSSDGYLLFCPLHWEWKVIPVVLFYCLSSFFFVVLWNYLYWFSISSVQVFFSETLNLYLYLYWSCIFIYLWFFCVQIFALFFFLAVVPRALIQPSLPRATLLFIVL